MTLDNASTTIGIVSAGITAIGVVAAVITIIVALRIAKRQKDLETLLELSNHLTAWHDDLLFVIGKNNQEMLVNFILGKKYQGPLNILLVLLGENKKFRASNKYREVIEQARIFETEAVREKLQVSLKRIKEEIEKAKDLAREKLVKDLNQLLDYNYHTDIYWRENLTDAYNEAMKAISDKAQKL